MCTTAFLCLLLIETRAHSVMCERLAVSSGFGGAKILTNVSESSGGSCGKDTHPTEQLSLTQPVIHAPPAHFVTSQPDAFAGVELVSRATSISRKRRNWETRQCQSKARKRAEREAKRKLMAQPENQSRSF